MVYCLPICFVSLVAKRWYIMTVMLSVNFTQHCVWVEKKLPANLWTNHATCIYYTSMYVLFAKKRDIYVRSRENVDLFLSHFGLKSCRYNETCIPWAVNAPYRIIPSWFVLVTVCHIIDAARIHKMSAIRKRIIKQSNKT